MTRAMAVQLLYPPRVTERVKLTERARVRDDKGAGFLSKCPGTDP